MTPTLASTVAQRKKSRRSLPRRVIARLARILWPDRRPSRRSGKPPARPPADSSTAAAVKSLPSGPSLDRYRSFLPNRTSRVVAILADEEDTLELMLSEFRSDRVFVLGPTPSPDWELEGRRARYVPATSVRQFNWHLRMHGPFDVIVDLLGRTDEDEADLWSTLFFHLKPHGTYALHRPARTGAGPGVA